MITEQFITKGNVNRAGQVLIDPSATAVDVAKAENSINQWRSLHVIPLNAVVMDLRTKVKQADPDAMTAQRLKRLASIKLKLKHNPKMQLSRMQDMAGGRAIVKDMGRLNRLVSLFYFGRNRNHITLIKDYIKSPKESGYRGIHLRAVYESRVNPECCGLPVEIQIRTRLQHIWATGVETVGAIINSPLKSNVGPEDWKEFFQIVSSGLALQEHVEGNPSPKTARLAVASRLAGLEERLDAITQLESYGGVIKLLEQNEDCRHKQFLLHFKPANKTVEVRGYLGEQSTAAMLDYQKAERLAIAELGENVVLVNVDSISNLRKAYPNYFADTKELCALVRKMKQE